MSRRMHKSYNVTTLVYHLVCAVKYRHSVLTEEVKDTIVNSCMEIREKYGYEFIEIGTDINHIHYLIQAPPTKSPTEIVTTIKSITAKRIFKYNPEVKKKLWGGEFWSDGYWMVTVSQNRTEESVRNYVKNQGYGKYEIEHKQKIHDIRR